MEKAIKIERIPSATITLRRMEKFQSGYIWFKDIEANNIHSAICNLKKEGYVFNCERVPKGMHITRLK
ncbi:hypothetical protein [uncultured Bacteroides sp.]|uniref:hypothetical protein n=1 Tax=uncultured Bacteroides sp. TaxID=162156 RepID=UPI0026023379|nr:hypothetical protein [uncultured Bacteroides sp.]